MSADVNAFDDNSMTPLMIVWLPTSEKESK